MRPGTLIALLIAVVVGLLGIAIARVAGWIGPADAPAVDVPAVDVLVASTNILEGALINSSDVQARPLRPDELSEYLANPDDYLPPLPSAVSLRVTRVPILADEPIRFTDLEELEVPPGVPERLAPNMYPVTLEVSREDSSGGLLRVGDWVDVYFSSVVSGPGLEDSPRVAKLAEGVRIILKRNSLLPLFAPLPSDEPIPFTLEANAYRAALLEYARGRGEFRLAALPEESKRRLEATREDAMAFPDNRLVSFGDPFGPSHEAEARRVEQFLGGSGTITSRDLGEIFGLRPYHERPHIVVEQYSGVRRKSDAIFSPSGRPLTAALEGNLPDDPITAELLGLPVPGGTGDGSTTTPSGEFTFRPAPRAEADEFEGFGTEEPPFDE